MLTKKELELVNLKMNAPYPGDDYSLETLKLVRDSLQQYKDYYKDREYEMTFSNGKIVEFKIIDSNIAHMLGFRKEIINSNREIADMLNDSSMSKTYKLLDLIANNPDEFIRINKESNNELFNFYRINVRNKVFQRFSNFYDLDFGCIHFNNDIVDECDKTTMKSRNLLFTESNEILAPYYMVGLADDGHGKNYIETLFPNLYSNKMFKNQTITYPISLSVTTPKDFKQIETSSKQKLDLFKKMKNSLKEYDIKLDYEYDFENVLAEGARNESKIFLKK